MHRLSTCRQGSNLLIAAVPSCGSDWFADSVAAASGHVYHREFFNPMCNWRAADKIGEEFGCESPLYLENIVNRSSEEALSKIVDEVWTPSGATMTKENWSHRKLWYLKNRFRVVCFARRTEDSMPPTRSRVVCWMHGLARTLGVAGGGFVQDAIAGYSSWVGELVKTAEDLSLPMIWWHDIMAMERPALTKLLEELEMPGVDCSNCADRIISSRMSFEQCDDRRNTKDADLWRRERWDSEARLHSQLY
jgi:hypothetical protein